MRSCVELQESLFMLIESCQPSTIATYRKPIGRALRS